MRLEVLFITVALLLTGLPAISAAEGGGPSVVVTHDLPADGATYVGNVNHFGWVLFDDRGEPWFHHNAEITVTLNGVTVYQAEPSAGHDYDGVHEFSIVFPVPGSYEVTVTIPSDDGDLTDTFTGTVQERAFEPVTLELDAPEEATAGETISLTFSVQDEAGTVDPHADVLVRILKDGHREVLRLHTHGHDEASSLSFVLPEAGTYTLAFTVYQAWPNQEAIAFEPFTATRELTVSANPAMLVNHAPPTEEPLTNRVDPGTSEGDYKLFATYDPYTSVGPWNRMRLGAVMVDQQGAPVAHVDFQARLTGPQGQVLLETESLHEYDGVFEMFWSSGQYGDYKLELTATRGNWTGTTVHSFSVVPPVAATAIGPQFAELRGAGALTAGEPAKMELFLHNGVGVPFMHGEVDMTVRDADTGLPILSDKLHTHQSGTFPMTLTFPTAGTYEIVVDPTPTVPSPTPAFHGAEPGSDPVITVQVAEGPGIPSVDTSEALDAASTESSDDVPAPWAGLAVFAGALVALAGRSRRRV